MNLFKELEVLLAPAGQAESCVAQQPGEHGGWLAASSRQAEQEQCLPTQRLALWTSSAPQVG